MYHNAALLRICTGPFNVTIGNESEKYITGITPSNATFGIWGKCFLIEFCSMFYRNMLVLQSFT